MRRKEREVASHTEILEILNKCDILRLGINTPDYPYIVPMNFGIEPDENVLTLWLHCAKEGFKLDLIQKDSRIGFETDCSHNLITGESACNYSMEYESVIGYGTIQTCEDIQQKYYGMKWIMAHYERSKEFDFPAETLERLSILRLDVMKITGKRHKIVS